MNNNIMQSDLQNICVQIREGKQMMINGQTYEEKQKAFNIIFYAAQQFSQIAKKEADTDKQKLMMVKVKELITQLQSYKQDLNLMELEQRLQKVGQQQKVNDSIDKSIYDGDKYKFQSPKNIKMIDFIAPEQLTIELISCIQLPIKFSAMFKQPIYQGILLYGPPGSGKTYFGMILQNELDKEFYKFNVFDFLNKNSTQFLTYIFQEAKKQEAALLFFDEIDAIIKETDSLDPLCYQLDLLYKEKSKVQIIATTNRPWILPNKLLFYLDKKIYFAPPNYDNRCTFIKNKLQDKLCQHNLSDQEMIQLVDQTQGYQYFEIDIIFKEASMSIIRRIQNTTHFKKIQTEKDIQWVMTDEKDEEGEAKDFKQLDNIFIPSLCYNEFKEALTKIKRSLNDKEIQQFEEWEYMSSKAFR